MIMDDGHIVIESASQLHFALLLRTLKHVMSSICKYLESYQPIFRRVLAMLHDHLLPAPVIRLTLPCVSYSLLRLPECQVNLVVF